MEDIINVLPEQVKPIIAGLIEGTIKQLVIIAEKQDGVFMDCYPQFDETSNKFSMIGAIECLKRDYMRTHIESRIEYEEKE